MRDCLKAHDRRNSAKKSLLWRAMIAICSISPILPLHDNGTDLTIDLLSALPRDLPGVSAVVRDLNPRWDNHVKYTIEPVSRNSLLILLVYHRLIDLRGSLLFAGLLVTAIRPGYQDFSLPLILARRTCLLRRMNASLGISVSVGSDGQVYGKTR